MNTIDPKLIEQSISYPAFHQLMTELVSHTSTDDYNEAMINYTRMNIIRMERLDKTTRLQESHIKKIESIDRELFWLALVEPWCGDVAQILPVTQKLADLNPKIETGNLLRDKNLDLIDNFLTDGSRSIPKILILDVQDNYKVLGHWGPRPFVAQGLMMKGLGEWRAMPAGEEKDLFHRDLYTKLQKWYARDKTSSIQEEFTDFLVSVV